MTATMTTAADPAITNAATTVPNVIESSTMMREDN
jgi:hypothetical protein